MLLPETVRKIGSEPYKMSEPYNRKTLRKLCAHRWPRLTSRQVTVSSLVGTASAATIVMLCPSMHSVCRPTHALHSSLSQHGSARKPSLETYITDLQTHDIVVRYTDTQTRPQDTAGHDVRRWVQARQGRVRALPHAVCHTQMVGQQLAVARGCNGTAHMLAEQHVSTGCALGM